MTLYRIPKNDIPEDEYIKLETFAFEGWDCLFFTDRATAEKFSSDVVEINPVSA